MTTASLDMSSGTGPGLPPIVPGKLILNGENPFIRLSRTPGEPFSSDASLWTITYSPRGAGHALFIRSELTDDRWRIYADNRELVRWLHVGIANRWPCLKPYADREPRRCARSRALQADVSLPLDPRARSSAA